MKVTRIDHSGNSAKFLVATKRGEFKIAISYTLRTNVWLLSDRAVELQLATELAEAIVSRHDPRLPYRKVYVFSDHNMPDSPADVINEIRRYGYEKITEKYTQSR